MFKRVIFSVVQSSDLEFLTVMVWKFRNVQEALSEDIFWLLTPEIGWCVIALFTYGTCLSNHIF